ncbi:S8 family serine peptidase [Pseudolabrys sp. FHR47]|uniref:S8 family serine peptidase n=1 Tax=Pseudolabrys sp. FHR47 TaxID=2562284 RepID=UPI0010BEF36F|nr:S8 family serine peptidase [Pseudolabrys sp. FHR47]
MTVSTKSDLVSPVSEDPFARTLNFIPNEPYFQNQWHLRNTGQTGGPAGIDINVTSVWDDYDGSGVKVGVYDDSVQYTHHDLNDNYVASRHLVINGVAQDPQHNSAQGDAHGTNVAGLIAAELDGVGTMGVAYRAQLTGFDVISASFEYMSAAMNLQDTFDVVNHSWGFTTRFADNILNGSWNPFFAGLADAVNSGRGGLGTIQLVAAGNSNGFGNDRLSTNASSANDSNFSNSQYVITVGAVASNGLVSYYSEEGASLLVCAPSNGVTGILTTDPIGSDGYNSSPSPGGDYNSGFGGTSAATPIVSGVVALMLDSNPLLGWRDVMEILAYSARSVGGTVGSDSLQGSERYLWAFNGAQNWNGGGLHFSNDYGFGLVDAHAAVRLCETWTLQQTSANDVSVSATNGGTYAIPDNNSTGVTFTVTLGAGVTIETLRIQMGITHSYASDLVITITSPSGTVSTLHNRTGGSSDFANWTFSSNAFRGEESAGVWTITARDLVASDVGSIASTTITALGSASSANDNYVYTDEFGTYGGMSTRGTLNDTSGTDTINAAAVTSNSTINLTAGSTSTIAGRSLVISASTTIENAYGGDGSDTITGNSAANFLSGGRGNDTFDGGAGADTLNGDNGTDTVSYASAGAAVSVNLATQREYSQGDILNSIENVSGSAFNDVLVGDGNANVLTGGDGNDSFDGGAGADTLNGGSGTDTVTYGSAGSAVSVNLATQFEYSQSDSFIGIENATGSAFNDILVGDGNANVLIGGDGNDSFDGGAGADTLNGGNGTDTVNYASAGAAISVNLATQRDYSQSDILVGIENVIGTGFNDILIGDGNVNVLTGGAGNDTFDGGAGADTLNGDNGTDTVSYASAGAAVSVNLATQREYSQGDILNSIENVSGSAFNDVLVGDGNANVLIGGDGNDSFDGGAGADTLNGGSGTDTVSYASAGSAVSVNLATQFEYSQSDSFIGIENVTGTTFNDILVGDGNANVLIGGDGNDSFDGGAGADTLNGGNGTDTVNYASAGAAVSVNLSTQRDYSQGDILIGIENVMGTAFNDILVGDGNANALTGGDGNDALEGGGGLDTLNGGNGTDSASFAGLSSAISVNLAAGRDFATGATLISIESVTGTAFNDILVGDGNANVLIGGDGNDSFDGGAGADTLNGGNGTDTVNYASAGAAVSVNLSTQRDYSQGDILIGIENVMGTAFNDILVGDGNANALIGGDGNDSFDGGAGADTLNGGNGTDTVSYASAGAAVSVNLATQREYSQGDILNSIENVSGSAFNDVLVGDGNANVLTGGDGNDALEGGGGLDTLNGGNGTDTASFAGMGSAISVNIAAGRDFATGATLIGIENVMGTAFNDILVGDGNANVLTGGDGNDSFDGGAGADTLNGGSGTDTVNYASASSAVSVNLSTQREYSQGDILIGIENVMGTAFNDVLVGDGSVNELTGGDGNDSLEGGGGADTLNGGNGTDTASFTNMGSAVSVNLAAGRDFATGATLISIENVTGSAFNDILIGDGNANVLTGGDGNDTFDGGAGADTLNGDAGTDTASYASAGAAVSVNLTTQREYSQGDILNSIENVSGSAFNDVLVGDGSANVLTGGDGNDTFDGGAGADTLNGDAGTDTVSYASAGAAVSVNLATQREYSQGDILNSIENVSGSAFNDVLVGDGSANVLTGGDGNDTLQGGGGLDTLNGDNGIDTASFSNLGSAVSVNLAAGRDFATGATLIAIENVNGSAFNDIIVGDSNGNTLSGGNGNDTIAGGTGADFLYGEAGNDIFVYSFGDGFDRIMDFDQNGNDQIQLFGFAGINSAAAALAFAVQAGAHVTFDFDSSGSVDLQLDSRLVAQLSTSDFLV